MPKPFSRFPGLRVLRKRSLLDLDERFSNQRNVNGECDMVIFLTFCLQILAEMHLALPLAQYVYLVYLFVLSVWFVLLLILQDKKMLQG